MFRMFFPLLTSFLFGAEDFGFAESTYADLRKNVKFLEFLAQPVNLQRYPND